MQFLSNRLQCTSKCHFVTHAETLLNVVSRLPHDCEHIEIYKACLCCTCANWQLIKDARGRSVVHWAAAFGKSHFLEWLLSSEELLSAGGVALTTPDTESGYTPLHLALLHGHLECARLLIDAGVSLSSLTDKEGLTPVDLIHKDFDRKFTRATANNDETTGDPTEVYSYGENLSYNLGHAMPTARNNAEPVDYFRRLSISIVKVAMAKFHTLFLDGNGRAYACGHNLGGRLGLGAKLTESVEVFSPQLICSVSVANVHLLDVAAGTDHSLFVDDQGTAYSCGSNECGQLGIDRLTSACAEPRAVAMPRLAGAVLGCAAAGMHSVFWTERLQVYFCGRNHNLLNLEETIVWTPKHLVIPGLKSCAVGETSAAALYPSQLANQFDLEEKTATKHRKQSLQQDTTPSPHSGFSLSTSHGAIAVSTQSGDVFLIAKRETKRIASKRLEVRRCVVFGGGQLSDDDPVLMIVTSSGHLLLYDSSDGTSASLKSLVFKGRAAPCITRVALAANSAAAIDHLGQAFKIYWRSAKTVKDVKLTTVERIPRIHRALSLTCTPDGKNWAFIQRAPALDLTILPDVPVGTLKSDFGCLIDEAAENDTMHDLVIECGFKRFPVHTFILGSRCSKLHSALADETENGKWTPKFDVDWRIMQEFVQFVYTDSCSLIQVGTQWGIRQLLSPSNSIDSSQPTGTAVTSKPKKKSKSKKPTALPPTTVPLATVSYDYDPVKQLRNLADRYNFKSLLAHLEFVRWKGDCSAATTDTPFNGEVVSAKAGRADTRMVFTPGNLLPLADVRLTCSDGVRIMTHGCVLAARCEYFKAMLCSDWLESRRGTSENVRNLTLPLASAEVKSIVHYFYTDTLPDAMLKPEDSGEIPERLCRLVVAADQLLIERLKNFCEATMAEMLTLRNAADLAQFSESYNAKQLLASCCQFICLNLAHFLETKALQSLTPACLAVIGRHYRDTDYYPRVGGRFLPPYLTGAPTEEMFARFTADFDASALSVEELLRGLKEIQEREAAASVSSAKKHQRTRKISENVKDKVTPWVTPTPLSTPITTAVTTNVNTTPRREFGNGVVVVSKEPLNQSTSSSPSARSPSDQLGDFFTRRRRNMDLNTSDYKTKETPIVGWSPISPKDPDLDSGFVSLKDIMSSEESEMRYKLQLELLRKPIVAATPTNSVCSPTSKRAWSAIVTPAALPSPIAKLTANTTNTSFTDIVREEERKVNELVKRKNKPLWAIQMEENAMDELLSAYGARAVCDEAISVERVTDHEVATPVWKTTAALK